MAGGYGDEPVYSRAWKGLRRGPSTLRGGTTGLSTGSSTVRRRPGRTEPGRPHATPR
jgi:hypothetical protein